MQPSEDSLAKLKQGMRRTWMSGDFGQVARYITKTAEQFVERLNIQPGMRVLDVACGTGNLSIPAARRGAEVSGVDIALNLLEQARERARAENLRVAFEEGDAEQLPFADAQFDGAMSMFGAMFAPRPERFAAEFARVTRPGGTIAMANWTPEGFVGRQTAIGGRYIPPPEGVPPPMLWGREEIVKKRLGPYASSLQMTRRTADFDFPFSPQEVVGFFREYFGPTKVAFSRLGEPEQAAYAKDLEAHWQENNEAHEGRTQVRAEFLEVIAVRK